MKTNNIAQIVWDAIEYEMARTDGKVWGHDTTHNGHNAFLYKFDNDEIEGEIIVDVGTKGGK